MKAACAKNLLNPFSHFEMISACDRQTETALHHILLYASAINMHRTAKITHLSFSALTLFAE